MSFSLLDEDFFCVRRREQQSIIHIQVTTNTHTRVYTAQVAAMTHRLIVNCRCIRRAG